MKTRKLSGFTLFEILIVVVIIGLLAAMALPAFQMVRTKSQDKAVINNLRQLSSAANQYFVEQGESVVATSVLVGTNSTQYVKQVAIIARETYSASILLGEPLTASGVSGVRTVTYSN